MPSTVPSASLFVVERRSTPRLPIGLQGVVRAENQSATAVLRDLTRDGCRLETECDLAPDLHVSIGIPGIGPTSGRIVWKSEREFGCVFDQCLPSGAITAAFSGPTARRNNKFSGPAQIGIFVGVITTSWLAIAGCVLAFIYSGSPA